MSAIYGMIDLNGNKITEQVSERFAHNYAECKIDRMEQRQRENAMMGCGIQYFTKEAREEVLPIIDEAHHIMFTADCVVDNREVLMQELAVEDSNTPDGTLLYLGYLKWGKECVQHFRGIFSFVVYDWEKQEVMLYADHFANRCLFYHLRDGVLYFSTMLFPMIDASGLKYQENERWLLDSATVRGPAMVFETRECAFSQVWKVDAGHYVKADQQHAEYVTYWNPEKTIPTDTSITDEECEHMVRKLMADSVKMALRTEGEVAVALSSGLDSTTIASLAAPMLAKQGKKLYGFTSVPLKESNPAQKGYLVDDETNGVLELCKYLPNIEPTFMECRGKNILNQAEDILSTWEMPCKSEQNAVWTDALREKAAQQGCRIMLTGATGNCTLSAGSIEDYFMQSVSHFRFLKAYRDLRSICTHYGANWKKLFKFIVKAELQYRKKRLFRETVDCYKDSLTRKDIGEKYQITKRLSSKDILMAPPTGGIKGMRKEIFMPRAYTQIGEVETKYSLIHGILDRDPIRDVDFIEYCMRLPMRCFVNELYDRRLVREFMHDIVPESIRMDVRHRGNQGSDNVYRMKQVWETYRQQMWDALHRPEVLHYLDEQRIALYFEELNEDTLAENEMDMRLVLDCYMFAKYVERVHSYTK